MNQIETKFDHAAPHWDHDVAANMPDPKSWVGALREYRREDYVFARTQSPLRQAFEWEHTPPVRSWGFNALADIALKVFG